MRRSNSTNSNGSDQPVKRSNIGNRIVAAAKIAEETLEPPQPVILVKGIVSETISVNLTDRGVLTVTTQSGRVIVSEPSDRFRAVLFERCDRCKIFVFCKLLRVMFIDSSDCMISIRGGVIGVGEFFRCKDTNVDIRSGLPVVQVESCSGVHFVQRIDDCVYAAKSCYDVTFSLVDGTGLPQKTYTYSTPLLQTESRHYMLVSKTDGFVTTTDTYLLTNIEQNLIFLDEDDLDPAFGDVLSKFGVTPK